MNLSSTVLRARARRSPAKPTRIDLHGHLIPDFYRRALASEGINRSGGAPFPKWTPQLALDFMDRYGIQTQVVCISEPGVSFLPKADAAALASQINEYQAELRDRHPGRFGALAVLPLPHTAESVAAAGYALDDLALDGVTVGTTYGQRSLGDPQLEPLWQALNDRRAWVFIHPSAPADDDRPASPLPVFLYEFTFETTRAVTDLLAADVFGRYPKIRWQLAHAGGTIPALASRLAAQAQTIAKASSRPERRAAATSGALTPEQVAATLAGLFYDTALSPAPASIQAVKTITQPSHIVFGSDWPFAQALYLGSGNPQPELARSLNADELAGVERLHALAQLPALAARLEAR